MSYAHTQLKLDKILSSDKQLIYILGGSWVTDLGLSLIHMT